MNSVESWWIDTDPGVDDAWAMLMMLGQAHLRVRGISVVGGNVGLEHTLTNARRVIDRSPYPVPVHSGAAQPLIGGLPDAGFVHGSDGFGEAILPPALTSVAELPAALALIEASKLYAGELNLLALGPLTNLALACALDPALPSRCRRLVVMGGAIGAFGNTRVPSAEFNIAFDPEAAAMIFARWHGIELVDWELTMAAAPLATEVDDWLSAPTGNAHWLHGITRRTAEFVHGHRFERWTWADPLAALVAMQPQTVLEWSKAPIEVALGLGPTRGQTVVDWHGLGEFTGPPVNIARRVDDAAFHREMCKVL
jgi:purine nucleosidase